MLYQKWKMVEELVLYYKIYNKEDIIIGKSIMFNQKAQKNWKICKNNKKI
jgi:hypothetical protein